MIVEMSYLIKKKLQLNKKLKKYFKKLNQVKTLLN